MRNAVGEVEQLVSGIVPETIGADLQKLNG